MVRPWLVCSKATLMLLSLVACGSSQAQSFQATADKAVFEYCPLYFNSDNFSEIQEKLTSDGFRDVLMDVQNPRFGPVKSFQSPTIGDNLMVRLGTDAYFCQVLLAGDEARGTFDRLTVETDRFPFRVTFDESQSGEHSGAIVITYRAVPFDNHILFVQFLDLNKNDPQQPLLVQLAIVPEED